MGQTTEISWTDSTWTPVRARVRKDAKEIATAKGYTSLVTILEARKPNGELRSPPGKVGPHCEKVSPECEHCYSETNGERCLPANGTGLPFDRRARDLVEIFVDENILRQPLHWKKPRKIFVCSQTDLFGEFVTDEMIDRVFAVMALCPQNTFQVLTKRAERMREYFANPDLQDRLTDLYDKEGWQVILPMPNVWLGVSAGIRQALGRIDHLRQTPAAVRFLSLEPLLEDLGTLDLHGIDWVIVGGESGPGARMMYPRWAMSIRDQCVAVGAPFFFKQWGAWAPGKAGLVEGCINHTNGRYHYEFDPSQHGPMMRLGAKAAGHLLDGREWPEVPNGL